jgi:hypothetical protein
MGSNGRILVNKHDIQNIWVIQENLCREMTGQTIRHNAKETSGNFTPWELLKTLIGLK